MRLVKNLAVGLLVLIGVSLLSLNFYLQGRQQNIHKDLLADINQLNDLSVSGLEPLDKNCNKVMGYMFESKQSDNYKLVEWCSNGYFTFKNINLNKNIVSINSLFPTTTFKVNGSGTNLADDNYIKLKHKYLGKDYEVIITVEGSVE